MASYEVQHRYSAFRDGQRIGPWAEGDHVDLEPADAEWVERDSPGCLRAVGGAAKTAPASDDDGQERQKPPSRNRQHRGGANRGN